MEIFSNLYYYHCINSFQPTQRRLPMNNKYIFNDSDQRYIKMNAFYIMASNAVWAIYLAYLIFKLLFSDNLSHSTIYGNLTLITVYIVFNLVMYLKNKGTAMLKQAVSIQVAIEFILLGLQSDTDFIYYTLIVVLALLIPYYDVKKFKKTCISYAVIFVAVGTVRYIKHIIPSNVDSLCRQLSAVLIFFVMYKIAAIAKTFSDHALETVREHGEKQELILDGILDISKTVQDEATKSNAIVDTLVDTTQKVAHNMREIALASNTTSQSIEEQNSMTISIQEAIVDTSTRSQHMVTLATDSADSINNSISIMSDLKNQSATIAEANHHVNESMAKLQSKTKEAEAIAGMILTISNRTNLLALNASIESARAGDAGKGFSVVAEQIRQLAEQTKKSTEKITNIIDELNENAKEVERTISDSSNATESQGENIVTALDSFEDLKGYITQLMSDINEVDQRISGLSDANNRIVENISHLSAATQEVTSTAEQIQLMSETSLDYAESVKKAINLISDTTDSMKKYM